MPPIFSTHPNVDAPKLPNIWHAGEGPCVSQVSMSIVPGILGVELSGAACSPYEAKVDC